MKNRENIKPPLLPELKCRSEMQELMDAPNSNQELLENTLGQFATINRCFARVRWVLEKLVIDQMRQRPDRNYHLVDLGAGACETAVWLLQRCRGLRLKLKVSACDHDHRTVAFARKTYGHVDNLRILQRDIMEISDLQPFDFVYANHLLHHLSNHQVVELLQALTQYNQTMVIFNDLKRSRFSYILCYLATLFFYRHSFVRNDGLLSIRKGFKPAELLTLAKLAGDRNGYRVRQLFPGRVIMLRPFHSLPPGC